MKPILFLISVVSWLASNSQSDFASRIDSIIKSEKQFNGVALIADRGDIVYYDAIGLREYAKQVQLKKNDVFELASVSKQFTAMIIMMLKEKGKLGYDDSVSKYLSVPYQGITIRHLLTHTSGLPDYQEIMDQHWDKTKVASNTDILEYLNKFAPPRLFEPGQKYDYSNTGYVLLASIAEKASGKDFIDMCNQWIFGPLKMTSTAIRTLQQKAKTKNFAIGHLFVKERNSFIRADSFPSSDYTIWLGNRKGPGRISSTAEDLLKWDQALYGQKLVTQTTLQEAFSPMTLNNGLVSNYGFGWTLGIDENKKRIVSHSGDNPGYCTRITRFIAKNRTIILLSNNSYPDLGNLVGKINAVFSQPNF
ncbi:MAG: beta-lactamase family protein [Chitinophagaceae bacterium]|nr:beta-lactamase family protein [Chitinophagaceae bacterium]